MRDELVATIADDHGSHSAKRREFRLPSGLVACLRLEQLLELALIKYGLGTRHLQSLRDMGADAAIFGGSHTG